ncbi:MAG: MarR family winged helix-turn-helix transcriptional regulator [Candidimonas sp.]|jgi:DNA-binding MarR family transcriptional regulator
MPTSEKTIPPASGSGYDYQNSLGWLMRSVLTLMRQEVEKGLEPYGLTNAQWHPMFKLYVGQADTVAELARGCMQDTGGMTRLLDRLEAKGLCQRQRSEVDRRVVHIALTPEGRDVAQVIPTVLQDIQQSALKGFSPEEAEQLKGYLRRILTTLQTEPSSTPD